MFPFDQLGDVVRGVAHGLEETAKGVGRMLGERIQFTTEADLLQAISIPQAVDKVVNGQSGEWHGGVGTARDMSAAHQHTTDQIGRMVTKLRSSWTGQSADAVDARIDKFRAVSTLAADRFNANAENLEAAAHRFDYAQRNLVPMPPTPPEKGFWDTVAPWKTDVESQIDDYNATAKNNAAVYNSYAADIQASSSNLSGDYGWLGGYGGRDLTVTPPPTGPGSAGNPGGHRPMVKHPGQPGHVPGGPGGPGGPIGPGDPGGVGGVVVPGGGVGGHGGGGPVSGSGGGVTGGGDLSGADTASAGYVPPDTAGSGASVVPPGGSSGGSTINIGTGTGSGTGTGVGFGGGVIASPGSPVPGGGSASGVGGKAGAPGEGRMTGAAPRPGSAVGEGGPGGVRGSGGGRGAAGMGAMAPGGGRGKDEDREHKRKYGIPEADETIALLDEETGKLIDPVTKLPVVPPTIGG